MATEKSHGLAEASQNCLLPAVLPWRARERDDEHLFVILDAAAPQALDKAENVRRQIGEREQRDWLADTLHAFDGQQRPDRTG